MDNVVRQETVLLCQSKACSCPTRQAKVVRKRIIQTQTMKTIFDVDSGTVNNIIRTTFQIRKYLRRAHVYRRATFEIFVHNTRIDDHTQLSGLLADEENSHPAKLALSEAHQTTPRKVTDESLVVTLPATTIVREHGIHVKLRLASIAGGFFFPF